MKYAIILWLLVCTNFVFAQSNTSESLKTDDFEITHQKLNCKDASKGISKEYVFLSISNTSGTELELEYKIEKWYDGICCNCDENNAENGIYIISLAAGESISGSCEDYHNRQLAIFSKMTGTANARALSNFKIIPISSNGTKY